jgi:uncharacterized protein DUF2017
MAGPFTLRRDGALDVSLTEPEAELLRSVAAQMDQILEAPEQVAHTQRLFPPAYTDDPDAQAEYARLMTADLLDGKRRSIRSVLDTLERGAIKRSAWRVRLNADEAQDWIAVLNDARLTLGSRLDVTEESYEHDIDPDAPDAIAFEVFRYLGYLEEYLVETLMG